MIFGFASAPFYAQVEFLRNDSRATDPISWRMRALARAIQPDAATKTDLIEELELTRGHVAEVAFAGNEIIRLVG